MAAMAPGTEQLHIFAWNKKLTKYVKDGQTGKAMQLFQQTQQKGNSDKFTFLQVIKACAHWGAVADDSHVHKQIIQSDLSLMSLWGVAWLTFMQNVGALRMLGECSTRCHLEMWSFGMPWYWDVWNVGKGRRHLNCFNKCNRKICDVGVLNACASLVVLEEGRCAHEHFIQSGWDSDVFMGNNLVHMYAKVDMIDIQLPSLTFGSRDGILLNTQPNDIFICLLSVCSDARLVQEGMWCYASMITVYMISAKLEQYTCMVDLIGHAGHLQETEYDKVDALETTSLHGGCCLGLAEFIVTWRWENMLLTKFLNWSLKMLLVMCCYEISMLLVATGIFVRMLNCRERNEVWRNKWMAPGLKWTTRYIHLLYAVKTTLRWLKFEQNWKDCRFSCMMQGTCHIQNSCCMMWKKKKMFLSFTRVRNWLLHSDSSTELLALHYKKCKICRFVKTATLTQSLFQNGWETNHGEGCWLLSSLFSMIFLLAWTFGDAIMSIMTRKVHFVCSMSSVIISGAIVEHHIRCGTTENVVEERPLLFWFPASTFWTIEVWCLFPLMDGVIVEIELNVRLQQHFPGFLLH